MKPVLTSLALLGALFAASCDDSASVQPPAPAPDTAAALEVLDDITDLQRKDVGFRRVSFQVQGGITGSGTGESLTLDDRGLLVRIAAKPLQTDSGPQWSGRYDTTRQRLRAADLHHVDSLLRSIRERPRKDIPDSAYSRCHTIADGFYWTAGVLWLDSDIATDWQIPSLSCTDKDGNMVPVPVPESITELQDLELHLLTTFLPSDSAAK